MLHLRQPAYAHDRAKNRKSYLNSLLCSGFSLSHRCKRQNITFGFAILGKDRDVSWGRRVGVVLISRKVEASAQKRKKWPLPTPHLASRNKEDIPWLPRCETKNRALELRPVVHRLNLHARMLQINRGCLSKQIESPYRQQSSCTSSFIHRLRQSIAIE